ncbi:MAG: ABC transporter transmembrane domain-containing protein, partial [Thermomicrobiales bacterium]
MHNVDPDDLLGKAYDSRIARRLLAFVAPYRLRVAGAIVMMLAMAASDLLLPKIFSLGVDEVATFKRLSRLNVLGLTFMIALVVRFLAMWGQFYQTSWLGNRIVFDLRNTMFRHLQSLSLTYIDRRGVGAIMTRIQNDVGVINDFFGDGLAGIMANLLILV